MSGHSPGPRWATARWWRPRGGRFRSHRVSTWRNAPTPTVAGATTTTPQGDDPDTIRVKLLEVRNETSGRVAVVEVDGVAYTVKVGDTFATSFKVVSLTLNGGVFTYGDSAFTLAVGQSILK